MQTLQEIIDDLQDIAEKKNYQGATVDALIYLLASSIYKNNLSSIVTILESSGSKCTLLNSAIQHALDKMYSVPRGKNEHITITNARPIESFSVKKFDECQKIGKYKLLYAKDYTFNNNEMYDIELVLCTELLTEKVVAANKKYLKATLSDYSEDVAFYVNGEEMPYAKSLNVSLDPSVRYLNKEVDSPYLMLTNTDFSLLMWVYDNANPTMYFDANNTFSFKSPKYLEESIDKSKIKNLKEFDISSNDNVKSEILITNRSNREIDVNNIFLASCVSDKSNNIIRSINDIQDIFLTYFVKGNILNANTTIDRDNINIYYLLMDYTSEIPEEQIDEFMDYLDKAFYVEQALHINKAEEIVSSSYSQVFKKDLIDYEWYYQFTQCAAGEVSDGHTTYYKRIVNNDKSVNYYSLTVPQGQPVDMYYTISSIQFNPYQLVENPTVDQIYYRSIGGNNYEQFQYNPYIPVNNPILGEQYWQLNSQGEYIFDTYNPMIPVSEPIVGNIYYLITDEQGNLKFTMIEYTDSDTGKQVYNRDYTKIAFTKDDSIVCYRRVDIIECYSKTKSPDFDITIYFNDIVNTSEITSFIESYKYKIGETFKPMKIVSELMSNFKDTITWIDLNSNKQEKELNPNEYFNFTYNITYKANNDSSDEYLKIEETNGD